MVIISDSYDHRDAFAFRYMSDSFTSVSQAALLSMKASVKLLALMQHVIIFFLSSVQNVQP